MIDLINKEVLFWRNGRFLGVAFKNIQTGPNLAYFPGVSFE